MVEIRDVDYAADGSTMIGRLALPEGNDTRPAVLIAHEGGGLDDYQKGRAARFAELGYVAFALDYHGEGTPLPDENTIERRCRDLWFAPERIRALAVAGLRSPSAGATSRLSSSITIRANPAHRRHGARGFSGWSATSAWGMPGS
jgi:dienelactone hydrolase